MPVVPIRRGWLLALCAGLFAVAHVAGQPKADPPKASAIKLPDGTIVFLTKSPDDANPAIEGVVLSPAEYKALTEKAELGKKAKAIFPSSLAIRGQVESRGDRQIAALTLEYGFRTTQPRSVINLGCQRAALVSAKNDRGQLPLLNPPGEDGLTAFVELPGEHTLTLQVEVPVAPRGAKSEIGFDLGLPRAAITTLEWVKPTANGVKKFTLGTRIPEGAKAPEIKSASVSFESVSSKPMPLGATDVLELAWEKPTSAASDPSKTVDAEIAVRVEENLVETVAKLRLRGALKEWALQLPANAEVSVERAVPSAGTATADGATVIRPSDTAKPTWFIRVPNDPSNPEWLATITIRQLRPKTTDPKYRGPYAIGPFYSPTATRHTGRIRISAPANIRLGYKPQTDVRRTDVPAGAEDDLLSQFQFAALPQPTGNTRAAALLELDARAAAMVPRVRPTHKLKLTPGGWQLETVVRVTPPPRGEVEQLIVEMPAGWQKRLEVAPEEIVDRVQLLREDAGRTYAVRFISPQKQPFEMTLTSTFPVPPGARELAIPLPKFPQAELRESKIAASVADGLELRGTGFTPESGFASTEALKAAPGKKSGAVTNVAGEFERGLERVELAWQPYQPELACEIRADITVQERQTLISQTITFKPTADDRRPIRVRGPMNAIVWQQSTPPLDPVDTVGSNEWEFTPPDSGTKEFRLTVNFAMKHPAPADADSPVRIPVSLFWPEAASRTDSRVRVWAGTGNRFATLVNDGQWLELPPGPVPGREMLPWYTLAGASGKIPITLELTEAGETGLPSFTVERSMLIATLADDGVANCRASFLLSRGNGAAEIQLPQVSGLEVLVDGRRAEGMPPQGGTIQVPLPEPGAGKFTAIELRYRTAMPRDSQRVRSFVPPVVRRSVSKSPLRWHVGIENGFVPLLLNRKNALELEWAWHGFGFSPSAAVTVAELEQWFLTGKIRDGASTHSHPGSESLAGRYSESDALEFWIVPRFAWILSLSFFAFVCGIWISRWPWQRIGVVLCLLGIATAIASALVPQPLAQIAAGMQPGFAALALFLLGKAGVEAYLRRRVDRLPAFRRAPSVVAPSALSNGSRPSRIPLGLPIETSLARPPSAARG